MKLNTRLFLQIRGVRSYLIVTVVLSTLLGGLIVLQARYLSTIINHVFLLHQTVQQVWMLLSLLLAVILLRTCLVWASNMVAHQLAARIKTTLRTRLLAHLFALGPAYTKGERSGELINTTVEGVEALDAYFSQYVPQMFLSISIPLLVLIAVLAVDPFSGLVLLITAPLLPLLMALVGLMARAESQRQWRLLSLMSAHFLDVLQGMTTLKLFGRGNAQVETVQRVSDRFREVTMSLLRVSFLSSLVLEMGATVSTAVVAVEAGLRLLYGQMPFESAFFVLLLAPEFYLPLRQLGARYHAGLSGREAAQRIFAILDTPVPQHTTSTTTNTRQLASGVIRFEHVSYAYDEHRPALADVSFTLSPGQKVALVGPSGAGKSTIANLLLRFIEADGGTISIDGVSLLDVAAQQWRQQVAWVPQRPYLFNATIADNIRLGCPDATMKEVIDAARQAHADEFIALLSSGYNTVIGERGARLSGGEAQRISLARAFLKNAPLLILDEATSHLDAAYEANVLAALKRLMKGRTVLVIAHRLSTVYDADQIVVLDAGRVVEVGTHQVLLERSGMYRQLVNAYGRRAV